MGADPKSFRIDDDTADKFKEISNKIAGNQQETMSKLIEAWEFQQGKAILKEKKDDIESFENHVNILTRMFMSSLEDNQNITETVRSQFDALLKSKDTTIQDLQENLNIAKQLKEDAVLKAKILTDDNIKFTNRIDALIKELEDTKNNFEGILEDKNNLNKALTNSYNEVKGKVESMAKEYSEFKEKAMRLDKVTMECDTLRKEKAGLEEALISEEQRRAEALEQCKEHYDELIESIKQKAELSKQKDILELERKHQEQIHLINEEKQKEIDKYQSKYLELLDRINLDKKNKNSLDPKNKN